MVGVIGADSLPCLQAAARLRIVVESLRIGQRAEKAFRVVEPAARRVRGGQVGDRQPRSTAQPVRSGQIALLGIPIGSLRKAHQLSFRAIVGAPTPSPEWSCRIETGALLKPYNQQRRGIGSARGDLRLRNGIECSTGSRRVAHILRITGLDAPRLNELYWAHRHAYDEGKLTGRAFWQQFAVRAGLTLTPHQIDELNDWDARMWTTVNPPMLAWQQQVKARGLKTAILSNMGDNVHERMVRVFDWLSRFDALVWSYQLGIAKPDPAIYRHVLKDLGIEPGEAFFIDDKIANIEAALALGMQAHLFSTPERLREDLIAQGLDRELPLPE